MNKSLKGVVLRVVKYKESEMIVSIYSDVYGKVDFAVKGAHGKRSKFKANLFQPLFPLSIECEIYSNRSIHRIKECRMDFPLSTLPFSIVKSSESLFLSEFLYRVIQEVEQNDDLFQFIYKSIEMFDLLESGVPNFHIAFLIKLTRFLGFMPQFTMDIDLSNSLSGFSKEEISTLKKLYAIPYTEIGEVELNGVQRERLLVGIVEFYSLHLGHRLNIKSLAVLSEVFH